MNNADRNRRRRAKSLYGAIWKSVMSFSNWSHRVSLIEAALKRAEERGRKDFKEATRQADKDSDEERESAGWPEPDMNTPRGRLESRWERIMIARLCGFRLTPEEDKAWEQRIIENSTEKVKTT